MNNTDENKLMSIFKEASEIEEQLEKMDKKELINLLVIKHLDDTGPLVPYENKIELWYYMDPETGTKYLTNELPKTYSSSSSKYPIILSDGEVNLRVPKIMEKMFPMPNAEGNPVKVCLSVSV
jgi:hypothetical protein